MGVVKGFSAKNGRDRGKLHKRIVSVAPALPSTTENSSTLDPLLTQSLSVYISHDIPRCCHLANVGIREI
jgi:hypothetical protein